MVGNETTASTFSSLDLGVVSARDGNRWFLFLDDASGDALFGTAAFN